MSFVCTDVSFLGLILKTQETHTRDPDETAETFKRDIHTCIHTIETYMHTKESLKRHNRNLYAYKRVVEKTHTYMHKRPAKKTYMYTKEIYKGDIHICTREPQKKPTCIRKSYARELRTKSIRIHTNRSLKVCELCCSVLQSVAVWCSILQHNHARETK